MKAIYYTVTFLAALVVLTFAGWEVYLHRNVIANAVHHQAAPCGCNTGCTCPAGKCACNVDESCSPDCDCAAKAPCCKPAVKK